MKVTRRGQVTIPKEIRDSTGIDDGTEVEFREENGRIIIEKVSTTSKFEEWVGFLGKSGSSDDLVKEMRGHHAHRR